jgi:hypothetical protein
MTVHAQGIRGRGPIAGLIGCDRPDGASMKLTMVYKEWKHAIRGNVSTAMPANLLHDSATK